MTENNQGHQSLLRWHIVDNVPFQKSFEGCIEKYFENNREHAVRLHGPLVLAPDGIDPYESVPVAERDGYYVMPKPLALQFKVLNQPNGKVRPQAMAGHGPGSWRNDEQLWWTGVKPGDKLVLAVPVAKAGKYRGGRAIDQSPRLRHRKTIA